MRPISKLLRGASVVAAVTLVATVALDGAAADRTVPLTCTRGPDGQSYRVIVTMPSSRPVGSTFTVRVAGARIGPVSHFGLHYIHDMGVDLAIPTGTTYVDGSARIVPETGSSNVRPGARVTHDARGVHLRLPAHVNNGGSYAAPTIEFQVEATGPAGTVASLGFLGTRFTANATIVGNVHGACAPSPKPYTIGTTRLEAAP